MAGERFYLPTEIVTGAGCFGELGRLARRFGGRALVIGSRGRRELLERAGGLLAEAGIEPAIWAEVQGEPTLAAVEEARARAREAQADLIVGIGGGSALDAAKAAAGLAHQPGAVADYHRGRRLEPGRKLPFIAVPTTAGTGAEVTRNAVLIDPERGVKESIRDDAWFPALALVDPELTLSLPRAVTASTGADALCQAIESYVSIGAGPLTDPLAAEAIRRIGRSLARAVEQGSDLAARSDMLYGSLLAGIAMTNARLGAVHGLAHPLGARYGIPHGTVCGLLLPYVMAYNLPAAAERYACVSALLGIDVSSLSTEAAAEQGVARVRALLQQVGIPSHLAPYGVTEDAFDALAAEALAQSSLHFNPRPLQADDVRAILASAL
ncbi:MAG: iron-containing alcohol dehydrogenase [Anaerolineae bacterium]|nr:iron-containing alcohol dehydrogenase [Anaerolineae bacterium]